MKLIALLLALLVTVPVQAQSHPPELLQTWATAYDAEEPDRIDSLFYTLRAGGRYDMRLKRLRFNSQGWRVVKDSTVRALQWVVRDRSGEQVLCLSFRSQDVCQPFSVSGDGRLLRMGIRDYRAVQ